MRSWLVWGTGLLAYVVAVLNRTAFGVSGLDAADRFGASPSVLSSFVVIQLIVYSAMQVPAGVLLDRFGSKAMITTGLTVMSVGQLTLALTHALPTAIGGYGIVGLGDAFLFISVIRLLPNWFAPSRVALLTQLTGICGQLGQLLSAVPFLAVLMHGGWTAAYLSTAALGVLSIALTLALVRDAPAQQPSVAELKTFRGALSDVRAVWSRPGTRLGFFTHLGTPFSITVFALVWGVPYLTIAQGMPRGMAGVLLTVSVFTFVILGVLVGIVSGRHPGRRTGVVLAMIGVCAVMWTVVLALPFPAPRWLLVLLVAVISGGQPVSIIAFDFARTFNPPANLSTAQGMVNTGGFIASVLMMQTMGIIISAVGGYSFNAFRLAWTAQYVIWAVAAAGVVAANRKARFSDTPGEQPSRTLGPGSTASPECSATRPG
ncbi:MAG TPA: MFS transporter [Mycobacterium sp.]|nr:MFS transporter [Mycobacterium sp.]